MLIKETNGKSLKFIKQRIINEMCNGMDIEEFNKAQEHHFKNSLYLIKKVFDHWRDNSISVTLDGEYNGVSGSKIITIKYNPNEEFEYFTRQACTCDGTMLFMAEMVEKILNSLLTCETYNNNTAPVNYYDSFWNYDMVYTVGDFVTNVEQGDFGTEEKPWLSEKFTALLPIKCEYVTKS